MGAYSIKQALAMTLRSKKFRTRFFNRDRDKVRLVSIQTVKSLNWHGKDRQLSTYFEMQSRSVPKYYTKAMRKRVNFFGKITHTYDVFLKIDTLKVTEKNWQAYLGSARAWQPNPPQDKIGSIYRKNLAKWDAEKIRKHRKKRHPYVDVGDYNAQANGINGDFRFRCCFVYEKFGHLFHKRGIRLSAQEITKAPKITNPRQEFFLPKHLINLFETLIERGILKV